MPQPVRTSPQSVEGVASTRGDRVAGLLPGLALCAAAVAVSLLVNRFVPGVSALIVAIVLGIAVTNLVTLPETLGPGITFAAKKLLRLGIVFLGLKLVLSDILGLGAPMLLVVACVVTGGILGTVAMGRLLRMPPAQALLIGCGFSICGAAAVAGVEGVTDAEEEEVVTAVALVVIFGTLMIPVIPVLGPLLGMDTEMNGLWAGASVHEIAQVVATGGVIGGGALAVAVVVKLARVLMLAPVVAVLSLLQRRRHREVPAGARPAVVPPFIIAFLAMVLVRSFMPLPDTVLSLGNLLQTALLAAAMFGLGCGVRMTKLLQVGARPFLLATASTVWVAGIALMGIELAHLGG